MRNHFDYMDKIVLFICCTVIYQAMKTSELSVIPLLIAVAITSFLMVFEHKPFLRYFLYVFFIVICFFYKDLIFFIPLIIYDLMDEPLRYLYALPLLPLSDFFLNHSLIEAFLIFIVIMLAVFIRLKSKDILGYKARYFHLLDTTKELSLKLEQQNQDLIDKQDHEIHIATLNERNRIAREIHDHVGHQLSSALLQIGALMATCKDPDQLIRLDGLKKTLNLGMNNIRDSIHNLYDHAIDLDAQLTEVIDHFAFCKVVYYNTILEPPNQKQSYAIISIVKEALSNIIKHAQATEVTLLLREHPSMYQLIIHDNGHVADYNPDHGIGLKNMTQRVEILKGHIQIRTQNGFEVFVSLPKI
ncbi:Two-component sensor histidine kinase [Petrocella atlantisensis]|uniref:histidine kinase n=1 Tax=Petrocella atlantisensis TaxID=2173034 RepID=A0A3P7Q091_9FIRM|nr:histidine kinase [Petrocella atlantisensis]VDN48831.1 Two-component sensor histidine kinase [Petrocella atlantisensis]